MSVSKMQLVSLSGPLDRLNDVLRICADSGAFQPENAMSFFSDTSHIQALWEDNPYTAALQRLDRLIDELGIQPPGEAPAWEQSDEALFGYLDRLEREMADKQARRTALQKKLDDARVQRELMVHFADLDIDIKSVLACETIRVRFGRLPKESYDKLHAYENHPYVLFLPGGSDRHYYWGAYFCPVDYAPEVDRIFSGLYFERTWVNAVSGTPKEIAADWKQKLDDLQARLDAIDRERETLAHTDALALSAARTYLTEQNALFTLRRYAAVSGDRFILDGWVPAADTASLSHALEAVDGLEYTTAQAKDDHRHSPPTKLKNAKLFRPFEFFVNMYGTPSYGETDPTPFLAVTYTLLFGVMFGDVGQGLVVALIGWLMWKKKQMAIGRVLIPCGLSGAVFGLVYGSVFGFEHLLDPLYTRLLGFAEKPIEVMQSATAIKIIALSVGIGLALLIASMVIGIVSGIRRRDFENALFGPSGAAGLVFYVSLIAGCLLQFLLKIPVMTVPYVLGLIVLPILLIFCKEPLGKLVQGMPDWKPESIGDFIVQNFFELFEVMLSYLSNTMSFLRVGAFVLVHAGMMMAVFALANVFGPFGFAVTVALGNGLVMVMEALLVAIQVMRLEFYEMFSRYYQGEGTPFKPMSLSKTDN